MEAFAAVQPPPMLKAHQAHTSESARMRLLLVIVCSLFVAATGDCCSPSNPGGAASSPDSAPSTPSHIHHKISDVSAAAGYRLILVAGGDTVIGTRNPQYPEDGEHMRPVQVAPFFIDAYEVRGIHL